MEHSSKTTPKLNIFALPNQTTVIFLMMITVVLGTVLVGSFGRSYASKSLAIALLILPLRAFLDRPVRIFKRYRLFPVGPELAKLQTEITSIAQKIGLLRSPRLVVSYENIPLFGVGTFRHWYIIMGRDRAVSFEAQLDDPEMASVTQAKLIHELSHFKTGDYWQIDYASELLRMTGFIMLWAFVFFIGLGSLIIRAKPVFSQLSQYAGMLVKVAGNLDPLFLKLTPLIEQLIPVLNAMNQRMANIDFSWIMIFSVGATYPYAIMGLVLWGMYRPKLWRTRELYADAEVIHEQNDMLPYLSARMGIPLPTLRKNPPVFKKSSVHMTKPNRMVWRWYQELWKRIKILPKKYPDSRIRLQAIQEPGLVFDNWFDTAILVGSLTLILEVLIRTPLTLQISDRWLLHVPTLSILIIVSLNYLIPQIAQGKTVRVSIVKIVGIVIVLRLMTTCLLLFQLLSYAAFAPTLFFESLAEIAAAGVHLQNSQEFFLKMAMINLSQIVIGALVELIALIFVADLLRRLFSWYGLPQAGHRLVKAAYSVIGLVSLFLVFTVLPMLSTLLSDLRQLLQPAYIVSECFGLLMLGIGLKIFDQTQHKYAQRCPHCGNTIPGDYEVGKHCDICQTVFHPWLLRDAVHDHRHLRNHAGVMCWLIADSPVLRYVQRGKNIGNHLQRRVSQGMRTGKAFWKRKITSQAAFTSGCFWSRRVGKFLLTTLLPLVIGGVLAVDLAFIGIAHKIKVSDMRQALHYAAWFFGSLAVVSTWGILRYRTLFRTWRGWFTIILSMVLSSLIFQQVIANRSLPPPLPFAVLVLAVVSFWAVGPATGVLLWYKDRGLSFFAWGLVIVIWMLMLAWRFQGNLFQLFFAFAMQPSTPWWTLFFLCILGWIIPCGAIGFVGYTIELLIREIFSNDIFPLEALSKLPLFWHEKTAQSWAQGAPSLNTKVLFPPVIPPEAKAFQFSEACLAKLDQIREQLIVSHKQTNSVLKMDSFGRFSQLLNELQHQMQNESRQWNRYYLDALERWQASAFDKLTTLKAQAANQQPVTTNIYRPGEALHPGGSDESLFVGREDLQKTLSLEISTALTMPMFLIQGQRRVGKTSFLNFLPKLLESKFVIISQNMQSDETVGVLNWMKDLRQKVNTTLRISEKNWNPPQDWINAWGELRKHLEGVAQKTDSKIILTFDEYENMHTNFQENPRLAERLLGAMRHFSEQQNQVAFLFTGTNFFSELHNPNWSEYFTRVKHLRVDYLQKVDALKLITKPIPDFKLRYSDDVINDIFDLTQGHPALVQELCSAIVNFANQHNQDQITRADLQTVLEQKILYREHHAMLVFWTNFCTVQDKATIKQILAGHLPSDQASLFHLEYYGYIINHNGNWKMRVPLFEMWLRKFADTFQIV
jgi:hypothetical protein